MRGKINNDAAPGVWSLGARARQFLCCYRQGRADFGRGAARHRLVLTMVAAVR